MAQLTFPPFPPTFSKPPITHFRRCPLPTIFNISWLDIASITMQSYTLITPFHTTLLGRRRLRFNMSSCRSKLLGHQFQLRKSVRKPQRFQAKEFALLQVPQWQILSVFHHPANKVRRLWLSDHTLNLPLVCALQEVR